MFREKEPIIEKKIDVSGAYNSVEEWKKIFQDWSEGKPVEGYARYDYPKLQEREKEVAQEIGADKVLLYNSGMAATVDAFESLNLTKNDVLLYSPSIYDESKKFIERDLATRGVKCIPVESGKLEEVAKLIDQYNPKAIFTETVGNAPDMPVVNLDGLFEKAEQANEKYQKKLTLSTLLEKQLVRKNWIQEWLKIQPGGEIGPQEKLELQNLVQKFKETGGQIENTHNYLPLRELVRDLERQGIKIAENRRTTLLELKSLFDTINLAKREKPLTLVLDNTLATETNLDLSKEIKKTKAPVLAVDSGTKFFARDKTTMGLIYSNSPDKMTELYLRRMRSGTYLPKGSEALLPELTKEEFDTRNQQILTNAKILAENFAKMIGKIGIQSVSHPNLPTHPNYEYVSTKMPNGATTVFYVRCENAWQTAKKLEEVGLRGKVEYGGSFGFDKTRIGIFSNDIMRIAAGNESPKELEKIIKVIESIN